MLCFGDRDVSSLLQQTTLTINNSTNLVLKGALKGVKTLSQKNSLNSQTKLKLVKTLFATTVGEQWSVSRSVKGAQRVTGKVGHLFTLTWLPESTSVSRACSHMLVSSPILSRHSYMMLDVATDLLMRKTTFPFLSAQDIKYNSDFIILGATNFRLILRDHIEKSRKSWSKHEWTDIHLVISAPFFISLFTNPQRIEIFAKISVAS